MKPEKLICLSVCLTLSCFLAVNAGPAFSGDAGGSGSLLLAATTANPVKKTSTATSTKKKTTTSAKKAKAAPKAAQSARPKASLTAKSPSAATPTTQVAPSSKSPTVADFSRGVKDALLQAAKGAVASLGKENGYFANQLVRIPMPAQLKTVDDMLRSLGQAALADRFIESMNRAAEKAVSKTADIFGKAVASMTLEQAASLVKGPEDAATRYFESTTRENLKAEIKPLVGEAMNQAQVTAFYSAMMSKAQAYMPFLGLMTPDLDQYVTDKALDGLFLVMAQEEKKIRQDPVARTTEILKKVFGGLFK